MTPDTTDPFLLGGRRAFLAGPMSWVGTQRPSAADLAGSQLLAQGFAHIKAVQETGGAILGYRDLELDGVRGLREVTHRAGGTVYLYEGACRLRPAARAEAATMPSLSTWGYKVIGRIAERYFVEAKPLA